MVLLSNSNIRMGDKKTNKDKVGTPNLKQPGLVTSVEGSTGCNVKANNREVANHIIFNDKPPSPAPEPALSCQALKHAVSALTRIDDFLLEEIGCGFFAVVYKATHRVTGEVMVMKINKDYSNRSCALREIQLMNRLSHPNILRFLGVCVHEGQLHALTEYISGGTLETLLANKAQELPWMIRIKLALDIAKGMNYLHSEGVIHRDLTSKNVLIKSAENRYSQAVIADFGLATKIPDPSATEPLPTVGCPWWMAPEVIKGKFYDQRADLFSYGIIMLEITGRIEADPDTMPRTKNFGVDYVKVGDLVEYCPLDFVRLAFMCCRVLPEMRPSSEVITLTLEQMYKSLHTETSTGQERLRKRSKSENNILQSTDSFTEMQQEDPPLTPQIIAQAMTEDDPHYSPTDENPFAKMSNFKDGRKLHEFPPQHRKCSGNLTMLDLTQKCLQRLPPSHNSDCLPSKPRSQSLPSSPILLKKAAEKFHHTSLHGSDAVQPDIQRDSQASLSTGFSNNTPISTNEYQKTRFNNNRTRSLGSVDFFGSRTGPGYVSRRKGGPCRFHSNHLEKVDNDKGEGKIEDSIGGCQSISRLSCCTDYQDNPEWLQWDYNSNMSCSVVSSGTPDSEEGKALQLGNCGDSLSTCSFISSCGSIKEEETTEVLSPFCGEPHLETVGGLICQEFWRPQVSLDCDAYDCSHRNKDVSTKGLASSRIK